MADYSPDTNVLVAYALVGWLVVGALVAVIVIAAGGPGVIGLVTGVFVGLIVGGGLGFLAGGRIDVDQSAAEG